MVKVAIIAYNQQCKYYTISSVNAIQCVDILIEKYDARIIYILWGEIVSIHAQADKLLNYFGLLSVLKKYGNVYLVGSYQMDMMVWNDLDIYIEYEKSVIEKFYDLINDINTTLKPFCFEGMQDISNKNIYYGFETYITGERWNVDIWVKDKVEIANTQTYCSDIVNLVNNNPYYKNAITGIKQYLIAQGLYGFDKSPKKHYHSKDIYDAVLKEEILTVKEFIEKHSK